MSEESSRTTKANKKSIFLVSGFVLVLIAAISYFLISRMGNPKVNFVTLSSDARVEMGNDSYTPQNFKIKKGTKVTFVNNSDSLRWPASDLHPSHLIYSEFDPKTSIEKGVSWTFTFNSVGEWGYHDHLAPYITGTIMVIE